MNYIDLHTHTLFSDGGLTPTQLVEKAKQVGLSAIAITDHDTIDGVSEALAAGKTYGVEVIPGVELSTEYFEDDLHITGYFIDITNPTLTSLLASEKEQREDKAKRMIAGFQQLGYTISYETIRAKTVGSIGRPHLAVELISNPANTEQIRRDFGEDVTDTQKIFEKYLGGDCPFYQQYAHTETSITTKQAIEVVHAAGGLAFLAHPHWDFTEVTGGHIRYIGDATIMKLRDLGLDGIEVINFRESLESSQQMVSHYTQLARGLDMLVSGGSDYHGFGNAGKSLGLKEEHMLIDDAILSRMKAKLSVV